MSIEHVKLVIGRAVLEPDYREKLFSEPEKALAEYELSEDEAKALKGLDRERFNEATGELEERISKAGGLQFFMADARFEGSLRNMLDMGFPGGRCLQF